MFALPLHAKLINNSVKRTWLKLKTQPMRV